MADSSCSDSSSSSDGFNSSDESVHSFRGVEPWRFEPPGTELNDFSSSDDSSVENVVATRLQSSDWCQCDDNCQILDRVEECVCCKEIPQIVAKLHEAVEHENLIEPPKCITQHPGFNPVCLNYWNHQAVWFQYRQQYQNPYNGPEHKKSRHIAYRQLVRWCWGVLGKEIRVPLPSCAVCCIRAHFPPPGLEEHFVFEGFRFSDE